MKAGSATDEERARFKELQLTRSQDLHAVEELERMQIPAPAQIRASVVCAECGEATVETRIRELGGRQLSPSCFEAAIAAWPLDRSSHLDRRPGAGLIACGIEAPLWRGVWPCRWASVSFARGPAGMAGESEGSGHADTTAGATTRHTTGRRRTASH